MVNRDFRYFCAECVGYEVDYSNYLASLVIVASSNSDTAADALIGAVSDSAWKASLQDVDADGDIVYSLLLTPNRDTYLATLRMDVANVDTIMVYVQCRERPGGWSVATDSVCDCTRFSMYTQGEVTSQ